MARTLGANWECLAVFCAKMLTFFFLSLFLIGHFGLSYEVMQVLAGVNC